MPSVDGSRDDGPLIMKAVRNEDGEMVATDVIDAAVVTARFRNVAERHGRVELEFRISVPQSMLDSRWQLKLCPRLSVMGDTFDLDSIVIAGEDYRKAQLKGYQQYERFLRSIVTDSTRLTDMRQLETFLRRNIPEIYAYRNDSTEVSDTVFFSHYGINAEQSLEHYVNRLKVRINNYRKSRLGGVYARRVKSPILVEGIRLDTVLREPAGDFVYDYVQSIPVSRGMKKAAVSISGEICESGNVIYRMTGTDALTYYISSVSQLVDETVRFVDIVTERRVAANTACYVEFAQGGCVVDDTLGYNGEEIGRIKDNLRSLLENEDFDMDSIVVTASSSPEGDYAMNKRLAERRSEAISVYFGNFMAEVCDSMRRERPVPMGGGESPETFNGPGIEFVSYSVPENWDMLDVLVERDGLLSDADKSAYRRLSSVDDPDEREQAMKSLPCYGALRARLYPRTRTVTFDFYMHRRGMVKDTVHTTAVDTAYMSGVDAIKDRDYARALSILGPYRDFNTALAMCALDYNHSALEILSSIEPSAPVLYTKALVHARIGEESDAVRCYVGACGLDASFVHRGNLDPEISHLITKYQLNKHLEQ